MTPHDTYVSAIPPNYKTAPSKLEKYIMASLLDLPNELLVELISYLRSRIRRILISKTKPACFEEWAIYSTKAVRISFMVNQGLQPLSLPTIDLTAWQNFYIP